MLANVFKNIVGIPKKEKENIIEYELVAIFKENADTKAVKTMSKILQENNAVITAIEILGNKLLAYPIKINGIIHQRGYYVRYEFNIEFDKAKKAIAEIEKTVRNNDDILKFIIVKI